MTNEWNVMIVSTDASVCMDVWRGMMLTNEANFAAPSLLTRSHHSPRHQQIGRGADGR